MKAHRILAMAATGLLALSTASYGTLEGFATPDQFRGYAVWDLLGAATAGNGTISGYGAESSSGLLNTTLSQSASLTYPAGKFGDDGIYTFMNATSWTIDGTTAFAATSLTLQVKFSTPNSGTIGGFFTPTLTIGGDVYSATSGPTVFATSEEVNNEPVNVVTWVFDDLSLAEDTQFQFNFANAGGNYHVFIDGAVVGVDQIPEPSTWVAMAGGLSMLAGSQLFRRRRGVKL